MVRKLIAIGGAEHKDITKDLAVLERVISELNTKNPHIELIPTASSIPQEVSTDYMKVFQHLGIKNAHVMNIRKRNLVSREEYLDRLNVADLVFFSGGNQSNISEAFLGTYFLKHLKKRYQHEGLVIAGTSAGAMALSKIMIKGGNATDSFSKDSIDIGEGLNFLEHTIIDTHFLQRGRFGRLIHSVAKHPNLLGLGLSENTGVIIKNENEIEVIGTSMAFVVDGSQHQNNTLPHSSPKQLFRVDNIKINSLKHGDTMSLFQPKNQSNQTANVSVSQYPDF